MFDERVVFLGSAFGQRLEPMRAVGHSHVDGPLLHALRYLVGYLKVEGCAVFDHFTQFFVGVEWEILEHLLLIEDVFPEIRAWTLFGLGHFERPLAERGFNDLES